MLLSEALLAVATLLIAAIWPTLGARWFERVESALAVLANRRILAVAVIGFSTLVLRIAVLPVEPVPQPAVHDEFAYLLQADTFAHGRLTNPTPPMWEHFETFHEIFTPTYCSKFFPGQGLFLALGKVVFGHPFWGVWLTSGLMCAAITWMLQGWFSPGWAFLGGALAALRFGVFGYWANSYWGGNVAAIGGALVLGSLPRIKFSPRVRDSLLMGLGLALLANSRPWEGVVLSLPVAVLLFCWMLGTDKPPLTVSLLRIVLPLTLVLGMTGGWLAYYSYRTTGKPLRTPYQVYEESYGAVPYMVWQHLRPEPVYRHQILRKLEIDQELVAYRTFHSPVAHMLRIFSAVGFFFGPVLLLPFIALLFALPYGFSFREISRPVRVFLLLVVVFVAGTEMAIFYNPHYSAPVTGLIIALILSAMQRTRIWNKSGLFLSRAVPVACIIIFALRVAAGPLHIPKSKYCTYYWDEFFELHPKEWFPRAQVQTDLAKIPGNHLIIVHYGPQHEPFPDWVYNRADMDHSRIVWARDMGSVENQKVVNYFDNRQIWFLDPDQQPIRLQPYPDQSSAAAKKTSGIWK